VRDERTTFPGRASLQRYDRPASTYAVLIAAPLTDFPFVACWTILGRAPREEEWYSALQIADNETARLLWMEALFEAKATPGERLWSEIEQRLRLHRLNSSAWGRLLVGSIEWLRQWLVWRLIERLGRRVAGLTRYTYRHSRKWLIRTGRAAIAAVQLPPRQAAVDDVASALSPEERAIFERLLQASRNQTDRRNARSC